MGDSSAELFPYTRFMPRTASNSFEVDWTNLQILHYGYLEWQSVLRNNPWATRGANIPEALTEAIVCLCTGGKLKTGTKGDVLLPDSRIGEVKATTLDRNDLTSFSPNSPFDNLYFVRFSFSDPNKYSVYDLQMNRDDLYNFKMNEYETFGEQAEDKRRPRFSIIENIINPKNLTPTWVVLMSEKKIIK